MLRARAASICAWRGDWLRPEARNCRGGEDKWRGKRRGRAGFGPASAPLTAIYHGRWGPDGGTYNRAAGCWADAGSGLREKGPRPTNWIGRCDTGWDGGFARVAVIISDPPANSEILKFNKMKNVFSAISKASQSSLTIP
jgi:hypothetical protein